MDEPSGADLSPLDLSDRKRGSRGHRLFCRRWPERPLRTGVGTVRLEIMVMITKLNSRNAGRLTALILLGMIPARLRVYTSSE